MILRDETINTFSVAIDIWGRDIQIAKVFEETIELQLALTEIQQIYTYDTVHNLIDEIADFYMVVEKLIVLCGTIEFAESKFQTNKVAINKAIAGVPNSELIYRASNEVTIFLEKLTRYHFYDQVFVTDVIASAFDACMALHGLRLSMDIEKVVNDRYEYKLNRFRARLGLIDNDHLLCSRQKRMLNSILMGVECIHGQFLYYSGTDNAIRIYKDNISQKIINDGSN